MAADLDLRAGGSEAVWNRAIWTCHLAFQALWQPRAAFRSPAAIERAQGRRVRAMVRHAYRSVPHYRETMDRLGLRPEDFETAADLARLPLIDRRDLQHDPLAFLSRDHPYDQYFATQTGGSSGEPVTVYMRRLTATGARPSERGRAVQRKLAGRRWAPRVLDITSPSSPATLLRRQVGGTILLPRWARARARELSLLDSPASALAAMNELRPHIVRSYGSYIEALFLHAVHTRREFHRPALVVYSADALSKEARRLLQGSLGIEVLGDYSAVEAPAIGFECEEHRGFHLNCDLYPLRIVGPTGEDVADGEEGEVVVSNLTNRATVLLNYRLGDVAVKLTRRCLCGRSLPLLSFLEGRVGDWVTTRDGTPIHPQAIRTLFTDEKDVWQYQVVQRSRTHFAVTLVIAPIRDRVSLESRLADKFARRLGEGTTIAVSFTDALPRTRRGKVRTVIGLPGTAGGNPTALVRAP